MSFALLALATIAFALVGVVSVLARISWCLGGRVKRLEGAQSATYEIFEHIGEDLYENVVWKPRAVE